jgi:hypothetical protein
MGWHYLEPTPRPFQGQAWEHVVADDPDGDIQHTAMLYALIDVRPSGHDDDTIRPLLDRQAVGYLAAKLAGTLYGMIRPARTSQIARLDWAANTTDLIITHRAGTSDQRVELVQPDERGLYQVVFDAVPWRLCASRFRGRQALERAWYRLDLLHRERGPILSNTLMQHIRDDLAVGVGDVLADFLQYTLPYPDDDVAAQTVVWQILARSIAGAFDGLGRCGYADVVTALGTQTAVADLSGVITAALQPVLAGIAERHRAAHAVAADATITCFTCARTQPAATSAHVRHGWICQGCGGNNL